ncbi:MAG: hypothetical protein J6J42_04795 [Lachnospiraceae bacterium]|nr:hypothetical protein [Lachnospiraceae bacterium]
MKDKLILYVTTALGVTFSYFFYYAFFALMMKCPFASKKIMRNTLTILTYFLAIISPLYGFYHVTGGFSRVAFWLPVLYMAMVKLLEKMEIKEQ